ncbi:hypothetical protein P152DRAFT_381184, partial [Eremomyces bilateralis CBS 781.70]
PSDRRNGRPNMHLIYSERLPIKVHPLPSVTTNPLSVVHVLLVLAKHFFTTPESIPSPVYEGSFSTETRSVQITATTTINALWKCGFFGKGSLSRSEPAWLQTEKNRRGLYLKGTSEIVTGKRRKERRKFKLDRQRAQLKALEDQLRRERGEILEEPSADQTNESQSATAVKEETDAVDIQPSPVADAALLSTEQTDSIEVLDQEHLQLSLEEAFFLAYGLGVLRINVPSTVSSAAINGLESSNEATEASQDSYSLMNLFRAHSYFPPAPIETLSPDDPFLLQYITYHHFRSLGWVVRPGLKFACDYMLYLKGPVFTHAEFAIVIVPNYKGVHWDSEDGQSSKRYRAKDWWRMHCTNRVQSHVFKTLVLTYVEVPEPSVIKEFQEHRDVGGLLRQYKVREFCIKRWTPNRNRD